MTARRSKFRWSDGEIRKALAPRALPTYTDEELQILRGLAAVGWSHILARRAGGRKQRNPIVRAQIRRILIGEIYSTDLPSRFRKTPTAPHTIAKVRDILDVRYGWKSSEATVLKDVKKIGTRTLRGN